MKHFLFILLIAITSNTLAQDHSNITKAAEHATNPLAFVTKLQFQPNYTMKDNGGDQLVMISRIMQPSKTIGLPFIKSKDPSKIYTIYRLEAPVASQTFPNNAGNATGLSDLILIDVIAFKQKKGLFGVGPVLIMPTASSEYLGSGKWSTGLAGVYMTKAFGLTLGILGQQFVTFAGDSERQDQNYMLFQPIITKIFKKGYFMNFSPIMKFDWDNDDYNIPLGVNFGKAFAKNLSMFIGAEYVVSGPGQGDFTIRLNINAMFASTK
ncbi:hypothetical protein JJL45_11730 [Tamlana sp. s12]|uniref:hypothetical protein n=1 Tax=Tamlana sp. s12 TaxID=1630406 RepID=UPI000B1C7969|nr:hypothetical protein [Tamlana sp. s12]QQY81592.1 hypothetical protein JJL45_11730 [Tamlana sp. s12]